MMKLDVDDVDEWYRVKRVLEANKYGSARVAEPEMVGDTKILHVVDLCGVLRFSYSNSQIRDRLA